MKNNRNEVVLKLWTENNRILVEVEVQGKQTRCGGDGGAVKTIVVEKVDGKQ